MRCLLCALCFEMAMAMEWDRWNGDGMETNHSFIHGMGMGTETETGGKRGGGGSNKKERWRERRGVRKSLRCDKHYGWECVLGACVRACNCRKMKVRKDRRDAKSTRWKWG